jgi:hypothetical protein
MRNGSDEKIPADAQDAPQDAPRDEGRGDTFHFSTPPSRDSRPYKHFHQDDPPHPLPDQGDPPESVWPKNPRAAHRPSYRSQINPSVRRPEHQGVGAGPVDLSRLPKKRDGAKHRLLALQDFDKRTLAYTETKKLIGAIEADLGGADNLSAMERQMIQHAAITGAMITDMEVKYLAGRRIDTSEFGFLVGVQHRLFSLLGLRRRPKDVTPSLEQVLSEEEK